MSGKTIFWVLTLVLFCDVQLTRGDDPPPGTSEAPVMSTPTAEEESYVDVPMLKATAVFGSDSTIHGEIAFSFSFKEDGAQTMLWPFIYKEGAAADATVSVKLVPYYYYVDGVSCDSLNDEELEHTDIVVDMLLPNTPVTEPSAADMTTQANLTGEMTVWDKVVVVVDSEGGVSCAWPKLKETDDVKEMKWTYACYPDPTWAEFAYAVKEAQLPLTLLQPIPVEPGKWFSEIGQGCCQSKVLVLGEPKKVEVEKIYDAATKPDKFGKFSMTQTCKTEFENSFLRTKIEMFKKTSKSEKTEDKAIECPKPNSAWNKAFSDWKQEFAKYKARLAYQYGDASYNDKWTVSGGDYKSSKKLNALDQLLLGLGFSSEEEMMARKQESISSLQSSINRLVKGDDIRHVASDIITELYTQNEWIRKPAEVRSVVKEIMCRVASSPGHKEAIDMIAELLKEMRDDSEVTLEIVLDRMIRKSILSATVEYRFGQLVEMVFGEGDDMLLLLRKRFMEGLGLDGAKDAFAHFSVEAMRDYIKSQGAALNGTIQRYVRYNAGRLSNDTKHIMKAVSKLTGEFVDEVMDNLAAIIKYPDMVTEVNGKIKHVIEDLIAYDRNGKFTEDLRYMLGPNPSVPIEGLPLRLMIFVIQPARADCNLDELVNYIPEMPKVEQKYWEPSPQGGSVDPYFWEDVMQDSPPNYQQGRDSSYPRQRQYPNRFEEFRQPAQQYGNRRRFDDNMAYDREYGQGWNQWSSRQQRGLYENEPWSFDYMGPGDNYGGYNRRGGQRGRQGGWRNEEQNGGRWW